MILCICVSAVVMTPHWLCLCVLYFCMSIFVNSPPSNVFMFLVLLYVPICKVIPLNVLCVLCFCLYTLVRWVLWTCDYSNALYITICQVSLLNLVEFVAIFLSTSITSLHWLCLHFCVLWFQHYQVALIYQKINLNETCISSFLVSHVFHKSDES